MSKVTQTLPAPDQAATGHASLWDAINNAALQEIHASLPSLSSKQSDVRLLQLQPGQGSAPICSNLETVSLDAGPEFEALSYSWRQADQQEDTSNGSFYVNDVQIHCPQNLSNALFHLRHAETPRTLWIDFVCINQSDTQERSAQVEMMGAIYSAAWQVVCFLGQADEETALAMDLLSDIANMDQHVKDLFTLDDYEAVSRKANALELLLKRPWFFRIWTVQEVVLARSAVLLCGSRALPWGALKEAEAKLLGHWSCCMSFMQSYPAFLHAFNSISVAASRCTKEPDEILKLSLCQMTLRFCLYRATDPRDHIYGLLGLVEDDKRLVKVDYSLSTETVFRQTAVEMMRHEETIYYLLTMFQSNPKSDYKTTLPSWVSNFAGLGFASFWSRAAELYNACGRYSEVEFHAINEETISYRGAFIDSVIVVDQEAAGLSLDEGVTNKTDAVCLLGQLQHTEQLVDAYEDRISLADCSSAAKIPEGPLASPEPAKSTTLLSPLHCALYRTVSNGVIASDGAEVRRLSKSDDFMYGAARYALEAYATSPRDAHVSELLAALDATGSLFWGTTYITTSIAMRFFITAYGRMGMGPTKVQAGDRVALLSGGCVPFILRPQVQDASQQGSQQAYHLVGQAYVDGIMDGEAVESILDSTSVETADSVEGRTGTAAVWEQIYLV